jgi:DNA-binding IclR family transcriptional regulator
MVAQQHSEVHWIAHPFLHELVERTGSPARLVVPHPLGPTCVDLVEGPRDRRVFGKLGGPVAWHAGTSPKLLLAYQPQAFIDEVLSQPLEKYTEQTVIDPDEIREQLAVIRSNGYHISFSDLEDKAIGIAAPVYDRTGDVIAAISVSGPGERLNEIGVSTIVGWVRSATHDVSRSLGYGAARRS